MTKNWALLWSTELISLFEETLPDVRLELITCNDKLGIQIDTSLTDNNMYQ